MSARALFGLLFTVILAVVLWMWFTRAEPPLDYAALKQPVLAQAAAASTDDDRLGAILDAHRAFFAIVRDVGTAEEAKVAAPHLMDLAQCAKQLDTTLLATPEARRSLLERRNAEVQDVAMEQASIIIRLSFRPKLFVTIADPMETLASTLQN